MHDLDRLFSAWLSGPLIPEDARTLQELLQDPAQRRRWRALAGLEGALAERGAAVGAEPAHASPISTRRLAIQPARSRRRLWWGFLIAACVVCTWGGTYWWQQQHAEDDLPRVAGRQLAPGEAIVGPASLLWADGSQVDIDMHAVGRVAMADKGLNLDMGNWTAHIAAQKPRHDFTLRSAQAVTRISDARLSLRCDADATSIVVEEGQAAFTPVAGGEQAVLRSMSAFAGRPKPPMHGLVGWWPLDEGDGVIAHDHSGQGHDGRLVGPHWTAEGLRFAGGNERIDIPPSGALATLQDGDYSLAAWYRPEALPPAGEISDPARSQDALAIIVGRSGWHLGIHADPGGRFFMEHFLTDHSAQLARTPLGVATAGTWYHLVGIVDRTHGETRIVVNGVIRGYMPWTSGLPTIRYYPTNLWRIGIGAPDNPRYRWPATGLIRDVEMYDRALDAHDILRLTGGRTSP